jgi:hypothetical protein
LGISHHRRIKRGVKGRITIIAASADANATGNGECFIIANIHHTYFCLRIRAKVVIVSLHEGIVLINRRLISHIVVTKDVRYQGYVSESVQVIGQFTVQLQSQGDRQIITASSFGCHKASGNTGIFGNKPLLLDRLVSKGVAVCAFTAIADIKIAAKRIVRVMSIKVSILFH